MEVNTNMGIIKVLLQFYGVNINESLREEISRKYDCNHFKKKRAFFNIIANRKIPIYVKLEESREAYVLHKEQEKYFIFVGEKRIYVEFNSKSETYGMSVGRRKIGDIIRTKGNGHLAITLSHYCKYLKNNEQCKFCNICEWPTNTAYSEKELLESIYAFYSMKEIEHISITGGTNAGEDKGLKKIINFLVKLNSLNIALPIAVECEPVYEQHYYEQLRSLGVRTISINYELLSEEARMKMMPGKSKIQFDNYAKAWEKALNVFGANQVYTNILLSSFDDVEDNYAKLEKIIKCDVIPSIGILLPNSKADDWMVSKDVNKQILYFKTSNLYLHKANLNPLEAKAGCPRNGAYSAINEFYTETS